MKNNIKTGYLGEDIAVNYLKGKDYDVIKRNYRVATGEIDIIASKKDILVFIEVKTRRNKKFGNAYEAVDFKKQNKIRDTCLRYIMEENLKDVQVRFDIIEVYIYLNDKETFEINHIINAFN